MSEVATPTLLSDSAPVTPAVDQAAPAADASAPAPAVQADATQQPPTDDAAPAAKPDEAAATPEKVVPEKYEFKAADGAPLEGEFLGELSDISKEFKLSQEEAQKVADLGAKMAQSFTEKQQQALEAASAEWSAAARTDKEFGGDKLAESLAIGEKALADLGTPELSKLLMQSKLANHPEMIRFLVKAGKAISQDSRVVTGGSTLTNIESAAQRMYPNMNP